jgi:glycosyltransferase involved in cell wall biosynthesis
VPEDRKPNSSNPRRGPIKVLHIISDLSVGGAEMMLYKLLSRTDRSRFDPTVISLVEHGELLRKRIEALDIKVHTLRMKPGLPSPAGLWRLIGLLRHHQPDLILGWMYHSCLAAQLAHAISTGRPPVLWGIHSSISSTAHEKWLTAIVIRVCALLSKLPAKIIYVSRAGQSVHKGLGYSVENSLVITNGIDVTQFIPSADANRSVRSELGLSEETILIGLVGRYHPMKDHANFLRAAALLSKMNSETHFLLAGRKVDHENQELCQSIQKLGLANRMHLLGDRDDLPRLLAAMDIFSLSSSYGESFPNVIGEAMACGVVCVVTDVGDAVWMVGDTGRGVPPCDSRALADALKQMIDLGREGREFMGRAARSRVVQLFPLGSISAQYESLFEAMLTEEAPELFTPDVERQPNGEYLL